VFTLSIEHDITDLFTWKEAFDHFAAARVQAGVVGHRVLQVVGEPHHLVIELDFVSEERAESFERFLRKAIWSNPEASPALAGTPTTRVLESVSRAA
jgi:hypothetical protein